MITRCAVHGLGGRMTQRCDKASGSRNILSCTDLMARSTMQFLLTLTLFVSTVSELQNATHHSRKLEKLVDCGVCRRVPQSTCKWCDGMGGLAPASSSASGSHGSSVCAAGLVNCGVCHCTDPGACNSCDRRGGVAPIITSDAANSFPSFVMMLSAAAIGAV